MLPWLSEQGRWRWKCSASQACVGSDRSRNRTQVTAGKSFLRLSLNLLVCSLYPLLLVLSFVALEDGYQGTHPPSNHQCKTFPPPHDASFKMLHDGLSF